MTALGFPARVPGRTAHGSKTLTWDQPYLVIWSQVTETFWHLRIAAMWSYDSSAVLRSSARRRVSGGVLFTPVSVSTPRCAP